MTYFETNAKAGRRKEKDEVLRATSLQWLPFCDLAPLRYFVQTQLLQALLIALWAAVNPSSEYVSVVRVPRRDTPATIME